MAATNILRRYLDAGLAFTQLTQSRAEAIVRELVRAGEVQTSQAQATVADLRDRSRKNTERLFEQVRRDVRDQVSNLGLATKADVARLERQVAALSSSTSGTGSAGPSSGRTSTKKASTKKASAKKSSGPRASVRKSSAKKTSAKKSSGPSASARRSSARKLSTKKSTAKRTSARKSPANKATKASR